MATYYNPYMNAYPINYGGNMYTPMQNAVQPQQYMINVDGEAAARAWQIPSTPQPNTIVPLFDTDGQHVYFKSYDAYGRMNPIRKGRIVFEDAPQLSETASPVQNETDMSMYAKTEDIKRLEQEVQSIKELLQKSNNQNRTTNRSDK